MRLYLASYKRNEKFFYLKLSIWNGNEGRAWLRAYTKRKKLDPKKILKTLINLNCCPFYISLYEITWYNYFVKKSFWFFRFKMITSVGRGWKFIWRAKNEMKNSLISNFRFEMVTRARLGYLFIFKIFMSPYFSSLKKNLP